MLVWDALVEMLKCAQMEYAGPLYTLRWGTLAGCRAALGTQEEPWTRRGRSPDVYARPVHSLL